MVDTNASRSLAALDASSLRVLETIPETLQGLAKP